MKPNEVECSICGKVMNKYWMHKITPNRNAKWLCSDCYYNGGRQADYVTHRPGRPAIRENESK